MKYLIPILILFTSCANREKIEKVTIRHLDTTVVTPREIIQEARPLIFHDTIVVENERVRTEVFIDTVFQEVLVSSDVKPFEHEVKIKEVVKYKEKKVKRTNWWVWLLIGFLIIPAYRLFNWILK